MGWMLTGRCWQVESRTACMLCLCLDVIMGTNVRISKSGTFSLFQMFTSLVHSVTCSRHLVSYAGGLTDGCLDSWQSWLGCLSSGLCVVMRASRMCKSSMGLGIPEGIYPCFLGASCICWVCTGSFLNGSWMWVGSWQCVHEDGSNKCDGDSYRTSSADGPGDDQWIADIVSRKGAAMPCCLCSHLGCMSLLSCARVWCPSWDWSNETRNNHWGIVIAQSMDLVDPWPRALHARIRVWAACAVIP